MGAHVREGLVHALFFGLIPFQASLHKETEQIPGMTEQGNTPSCVIGIRHPVIPQLALKRSEGRLCLLEAVAADAFPGIHRSAGATQ
jgi:hypothetical protein